MAFCYMNGEFIPRDAATLPITDLAIQRGVGVFDSIRTYRRKPFTLTAHLDRLFSSAREARIEPPVTDEALRRIIFDGISRMEGECLIRPFITGGDVNLSGTFPRARFFVLFEPLRPLPPERYAEGVLLLPLELRRSTPTTKSIDYMAPLMARGGREEVFEILYCSDGEITEATSSSFFLVHGGKILTAPLEQVLSGSPGDWSSASPAKEVSWWKNAAPGWTSSPRLRRPSSPAPSKKYFPWCAWGMWSWGTASPAPWLGTSESSTSTRWIGGSNLPPSPRPMEWENSRCRPAAAERARGRALLRDFRRPPVVLSIVYS